MTTVYVPRVIRTAEDAAALPEGALLFNGSPVDSQRLTRIDDEWWDIDRPGALAAALRLAEERGAAYPVALVPVEVFYHTLPMSDGGVIHRYEAVWHPYLS